MQIIQKKIEDLVPYENNPRINDEAVEYVAESIKEFGFKVPIVIDKNNVIVCGHTRYKASMELELKEVPCIIADDLTPEQIRAFRIADNKTAEIATWDMEKLELEMDELASFDMPLFGFNGGGGKFQDSDETEVIEDEYDVELPEEPKAKQGDIYQLGNHRLMCGDSMSVTDVAKLMNSEKADMVFTDPPYGIDYSGGRTQVVKDKEYGKLKNDDLQGDDLGALICNVFTFNKAEADVYICVSPIMQKPFLDYIEKSNKKIDAVIVWDKKTAGLGYMAYRRQCEFILFVKGKAFKKGDNSDFDLWSISRDNTNTYVHGTQKPVRVSGRAIENSSKSEDIILDLFGGSGSTLIACEQLNRKCRMMELDPKYVDVIIKRWEEFTGKKAVLISGNNETTKTA